MHSFPLPLAPSPLEALDPLRKEILTLQPALFRPDRFQAHSWIGKCCDTKTLFEPKRYAGLPSDRGISVLAKVMLGLAEGPDRVHYEDFTGFPYRVLLLRDPRDRIISGTLFVIHQMPQIYQSRSNLEHILELLRRKENAPRSLSVATILGEIRRLAGGKSLAELWEELQDRHLWIYNFVDRLGDHLTLRYEDLVDGRIAPLEAYLGLSLDRQVEVGSEHDHVARTKGHGDWRNWFLEEDVEYFKPIVNSYLEHFGYTADWRISENPVICEAHCSGYVARTLRKRTASSAKL